MQLGIITSADQAITGSELDAISDEEFETAVEKYSVYARVQPEHKTRIVKAWQKKGKITAMTGDGVNDAPSIKNADIGVGMGITGTDVTKNVADMILADDNFATIVSAVGEGRRIYDNIRKAIQFLLASNLSEVFTIFIATLFAIGAGHIFAPVHLLFINLITDCLPAIALGMEKPERDVMNRAPRNPKESIFAGGLDVNVIYQGILVALITLSSYVLGYYVLSDHNAVLATTMAFMTLSMAEVFHAFNMRSLKNSIFTIKNQNKMLWLAGCVSFVLSTLLVTIKPIANVFSLTPLSIVEYGIAIGVAFLVIPVVELVKLITRVITKK